MLSRRVLATAFVLSLAACAAPLPDRDPDYPGAVSPSDQAGAIEAPSLGFFSRIRVPDGGEPVLRLKAKGVQVFRCESRPGGPTWAFRLPEADLFNEQGEAVARHGAGFSFEHADGSRLVGSVAAYDEASPSDLRWLLLSTKSFGTGMFSGVNYVQRVNTRGGVPPPQCNAAQLDRLLRVDFSADFVFYRAPAAR
jgi:hypothetical protein